MNLFITIIRYLPSYNIRNVNSKSEHKKKDDVIISYKNRSTKIRIISRDLQYLRRFSVRLWLQLVQHFDKF